MTPSDRKFLQAFYKYGGLAFGVWLTGVFIWLHGGFG